MASRFATSTRESGVQWYQAFICKTMIAPPAGTFLLQIPEGVNAGETIQCVSPSGVTLQVQVPQGMGPGQQITVADPGASNQGVPMGIPVADPNQPQTMGKPQGMFGGMMQGVQDMFTGGAQQAAAQVTALVAPPQISMETIEGCIGRQSRIEVIEKANLKEMGINFVMEQVVGTSLDIDLPNKYNIVGADGQPIFFGMEVTSTLESTLGFDYALDLFYVENGANQLVYKLRHSWGGDEAWCSVYDINDKLVAAVPENIDSWCCCDKNLSIYGCHECICDKICPNKFIAGCCSCCFCCCVESTYLVKMPGPDGTIEGNSMEEDKEVNMDESDLVVQMNRGPCSCPCCDGCCGGGRTWTVLQDATRDKDKDPLQLYNGTEIGSLKRKGRGVFATWILPSHDSDHWKLDFERAKTSKDKLLLLAMVLWMDHSDLSQANDA